MGELEKKEIIFSNLCAGGFCRWITALATDKEDQWVICHRPQSDSKTLVANGNGRNIDRSKITETSFCVIIRTFFFLRFL